MRPALVALAALVALVLHAAGARADGLSAAESDRLSRGETVARAQTLDRADRHYVGGVTYTMLDATPDELLALLDDVAAWRRILPRTRSARAVGSSGGDALVELTQGTALVQATYTMRVHRDGRAVRFWLDPSRPHGIEDAWGFLRAEAALDGRTLLTYGILVDVGDGMVRDFFEERVRAYALSVPDRVRDWMAERRRREAAEGRRASLW